MKKKLFSLMLLMFVCSMQTTVFAQNNNRGNVEKKARPQITQEQMVKRQTNFIAYQIGLDDAGTKKFSELYKKYLTEQRDCQNELRTKFAHKDKKDRTELTDAEITERIEARFAQSRKLLDIREKYYREFKKFMNPKQIQKMYKAEKDVKRKVHREVGDRIKAKKNRNK